jgi:hypothetical protein
MCTYFIESSNFSRNFNWCRANQSLLFLHNAANLAEKQQIPIYWSLVWSDRGSNPRSTAFKASMRFEQIVTEHISVKLKQIHISKRILMQSLTINRWYGVKKHATGVLGTNRQGSEVTRQYTDLTPCVIIHMGNYFTSSWWYNEVSEVTPQYTDLTPFVTIHIDNYFTSSWWYNEVSEVTPQYTDLTPFVIIHIDNYFINS